MGIKYLIRKILKTTILLIEDSESQADMTRVRLESLGFKVVWCRSAAEAMDVAEKSNVDCNVVDWVTGETLEFRKKVIRTLTTKAPTIIYTIDLEGLMQDAPEFAGFAVSKELEQSKFLSLVEDTVRRGKSGWHFVFKEEPIDEVVID